MLGAPIGSSEGPKPQIHRKGRNRKSKARGITWDVAPTRRPAPVAAETASDFLDRLGPGIPLSAKRLALQNDSPAGGIAQIAAQPMNLTKG
jgi:hypothetical protein